MQYKHRHNVKKKNNYKICASYAQQNNTTATQGTLNLKDHCHLK